MLKTDDVIANAGPIAILAPPEQPTLQQQRDALRKGLGRAYLWAKSLQLDHGLLREACLSDWRFDRQCEERRNAWLWKILEAADATAIVRGDILKAVRSADGEAADQLQGLAGEYARRGDRAMLECLRELVARRGPDPDAADGEDDLIRADGRTGFLFAVHHRGVRLPEEAWGWRHDALMRDAIAAWGRETVLESIAESPLPGCGTFLSAWPDQPYSPVQPRELHQREMEAITLEEILATARGGPGRHHFRGWGRHASQHDLQSVLQAILAESEPTALKLLLTVFSNRAMPVVPAELLRLLDHPDETVQARAAQALEQNSHPLIREAALARLCNHEQAATAIGLLVRNFRSGDEPLLTQAVHRVQGRDERHGACMDVRRLLEENNDCESSVLGLMAYELTPCSLCRTGAAMVMKARGTLPEWVAAEVIHDADDGFEEPEDT